MFILIIRYNMETKRPRIPLSKCYVRVSNTDTSYIQEPYVIAWGKKFKIATSDVNLFKRNGFSVIYK